MTIRMEKYLQLPKVKYQQITDEFLTKRLLEDIEQIDINNSEMIFMFSHRRFSFYKKLYILLAHALSKRGIPSCFLFKSSLLNSHFSWLDFTLSKHGYGHSLLFKHDSLSSYLPKLVINGQEISSSLYVEIPKIKISDGQKRSLNFKWIIDLEHEKIEAHGVNLFPLVKSNLKKLYKRYNIDFTDKDIISTCHEIVHTCDLILRYFLLLKDYATEHNTEIRIVGMETNYIPNGIFRILCDHLSDNRDVEYLDVGRGNMAYFGYHFRDSYIASKNYTRSKSEYTITVSKEELEQIAKDGDKKNEIAASANRVLKQEKKRDVTESQKKILDVIEKYRSQNKKVFVLFTHLFYDTPIYDTSPSFKDMCDWILGTIEFFNNRDDLLLLKPHPVEIRPDEPQKEPNETLASFLDDQVEIINDNICLLEPRLFTMDEICPYMTCGLIWRSSVGMELAYRRIPCIISGAPAYKSLDLIYPKNKENYFKLIERAKELKVTKEQALNTARYIYCLKNKNIHINCLQYDKNSRNMHWNQEALQDYLKNGNKNVDILIDQMLD